MRINQKELLTRVLILLVGLTIAHLGVTLFILADLGSDPFNVLVQGIFRSIGKVLDWSLITHGRVHIVICFLIILALLVVDKSYIKIGTILCMIFGGPIIDIFTVILAPLFEITDSFFFKVLMLAIMFGIFYFMLIRPENKRKKEAEQTRNSIKNGDQVTTIGGIIGTVVHVKEDKFVMETSADQVRIEFAKWAISSNDTAAAAAAEEAKKAREAREKAKAVKKAEKNKEK